jgi:hypothetical protein
MANMITSQKVARVAAFDLFMVLLLQFNVANRAGSEETDRCGAAFAAMLFSLGAQCQSLFSSFQRAAAFAWPTASQGGQKSASQGLALRRLED